MNMLRKNIFFIVLVVLNFFYTTAQVTITEKEKPKPKPTTRILFVYDASQSMLGTWQSDRKISIASKLMSELLDSLKNITDLQLGLRIYGHQKYYPPQDLSLIHI